MGHSPTANLTLGNRREIATAQITMHGNRYAESTQQLIDR